MQGIVEHGQEGGRGRHVVAEAANEQDEQVMVKAEYRSHNDSHKSAAINLNKPRDGHHLSAATILNTFPRSEQANDKVAVELGVEKLADDEQVRNKRRLKTSQ